MITFKRQSMFERFRRWVSPSYRAKQDAETRTAIKWLLENPNAPCMVDLVLIPNGYGTPYEDRT